jgi:hypothetical protein
MKLEILYKSLLTSKNIPNSVSGIFRARFGEASTLRLASWVTSNSDAKHLHPAQNRSKKQKMARVR